MCPEQVQSPPASGPLNWLHPTPPPRQPFLATRWKKHSRSTLFPSLSRLYLPSLIIACLLQCYLRYLSHVCLSYRSVIFMEAGACVCPDHCWIQNSAWHIVSAQQTRVELINYTHLVDGKTEAQRGSGVHLKLPRFQTNKQTISPSPGSFSLMPPCGPVTHALGMMLSLVRGPSTPGFSAPLTQRVGG